MPHGRWFRRNTDPLLTSATTCYPGRQQRFDLQVHYQGSWVPADPLWVGLSANGKSVVTLEAPGESGGGCASARRTSAARPVTA